MHIRLYVLATLRVKSGRYPNLMRFRFDIHTKAISHAASRVSEA